MQALSFLILALIIVACKDSSTGNNNGPESMVTTYRIYNTQSPLISDSAMTIVRNLFQNNGLSLNNIQVWRLNSDTLGHTIKCHQFYQGLQLFMQEVYFHFNKQDTYYALTGVMINNITIDTLPKVALNTAGGEFYVQISNDSWYHDSLSAFCNYGFNAELGYFDLNRSSYSKNFVLAWKITIANGREAPMAYIRADSLQLIQYANGVIIN
jgi:hypothetical protein